MEGTLSYAPFELPRSKTEGSGQSVLNGTVIRFADCELDSASRELRRNGVEIHLQRQAFEILVLLVSRPGALVTRMEIREKLWPNDAFSDIDSRLNFQIRNIRSALGDDPDHPVYIATVPKSGYKFIASVGFLPAPQRGEQATPPSRTVSLLDSLRSKPSQIWVLVVVVLAVVGGAVGVQRLLPKPEKDASVTADADRRVPSIGSVTPVLPFATQRIVITGSGFGIQAPYTGLDTPFIAMRDKTGQWSAGRITPENADDVTLNVSKWTDSQIIVEGFSGAYGAGTRKLNPGDEIETAVWNPQNGAGPARFRLQVAEPPSAQPAAEHSH